MRQTQIALAALLTLAACETAPPEPPLFWFHPTATQAQSNTDQWECSRDAAMAAPPSQRILAYDAGSLGEVRRSPTAAELTADGASLSASQWGLRRVAEQRAEGSEVKPEDGREGPVRYADGGRVGLVAHPSEQGMPAGAAEKLLSQCPAEFCKASGLVVRC